ncbi:MAG: hypothetical protein WBC91_08565 [Phototrophicaceae bacterium]
MVVKLWHIYFVENCQHTKPEPKDKFVIPVCEIDGQYIGFLINSRISRFIQSRDHLLECQSHLKEVDHPCLTHDSIVACNTPYLFSESDFINYRHAVSEDAKQLTLETVKICTTIQRRYKRKILEDT